jgi:hypothetical protein
MGSLWQTLRYTLRVLAKNPGFTIVAILSLALGIGANTAIFTLINALLLRDLPVRQPERLVQLSPIRQGDKITFSYPMFREVERGQRVFSELMAWSTNALSNVEVNGVLAQDRVLAVSGNAYSELGTTPLFGRLLTPDDSNLSAGANPQVAVIGMRTFPSPARNSGTKRFPCPPPILLPASNSQLMGRWSRLAFSKPSEFHCWAVANSATQRIRSTLALRS